MSDPLLTLVEQWREKAARHAEHGDCYRRGQGWGLSECADELEAALRAQPRETPQTCQTWAPIDTAPKDGTEVLVWARGEHFIAWFGAQEKPYLPTGWQTECSNHLTPTHWQPLPAPPEPAPSTPETP